MSRNNQFASYATSVAFRIDLSKRMVQGLMRCANGHEFDTQHYGAAGLIARGLAEVTEGQEGKWTKTLVLTEAGQKVAELCRMAGLGED